MKIMLERVIGTVVDWSVVKDEICSKVPSDVSVVDIPNFDMDQREGLLLESDTAQADQVISSIVDVVVSGQVRMTVVKGGVDGS